MYTQEKTRRGEKGETPPAKSPVHGSGKNYGIFPSHNSHKLTASDAAFKPHFKKLNGPMALP